MNKTIPLLALAFATIYVGAQGLPPATPITEIQPSPASIGADVPATYFGTAPSTVQKELIGPYQLLLSWPLYSGSVMVPASWSSVPALSSW